MFSIFIDPFVEAGLSPESHFTFYLLASVFLALANATYFLLSKHQREEYLLQKNGVSLVFIAYQEREQVRCLFAIGSLIFVLLPFTQAWLAGTFVELPYNIALGLFYFFVFAKALDYLVFLTDGSSKTYAWSGSIIVTIGGVSSTIWLPDDPMIAMDVYGVYYLAFPLGVAYLLIMECMGWTCLGYALKEEKGLGSSQEPESQLDVVRTSTPPADVVRTSTPPVGGSALDRRKILL